MLVDSVLPYLAWGAWLVVLLVGYLWDAALVLSMKRMLEQCPTIEGQKGYQVVTRQTLDGFCRATTLLTVLRPLKAIAYVLAVLSFGKTFCPEAIRKVLTVVVTDEAVLWFCAPSAVAMCVMMKANFDQFRLAFQFWLARQPDRG